MVVYEFRGPTAPLGDMRLSVLDYVIYVVLLLILPGRAALQMYQNIIIIWNMLYTRQILKVTMNRQADLQTKLVLSLPSYI